MKSSKRPVAQMIRRLSARSAYTDPNLAMFDFEDDTPDTSEDLHLKEVKAMADFGDINVPPSTVLRISSTRQALHVNCAGFNLSSL